MCISRLAGWVVSGVRCAGLAPRWCLGPAQLPRQVVPASVDPATAAGGWLTPWEQLTISSPNGIAAPTLPRGQLWQLRGKGKWCACTANVIPAGGGGATAATHSCCQVAADAWNAQHGAF